MNKTIIIGLCILLLITLSVFSLRECPKYYEVKKIDSRDPTNPLCRTADDVAMKCNGCSTVYYKPCKMTTTIFFEKVCRC